MKHLHLFEAWSHQWKNLQKAYSNRLETGVQQGRSARRLMNFAKRKVTEDKFRVTDAAGNEFLFHFNPEFLVSPLQFLDEHFRYSNSIAVPIVVDAINKIPVPPVDNPKTSIQISKRQMDGKPEMKLVGEIDYQRTFNVFTGEIKADLSQAENQEGLDVMKSMVKNFQNLPEKDRSLVSSIYPTVRFSNQRELEDFLGTYVQAIISDPIDKESANAMWGKLLGDRVYALEGFPVRPEEGLNPFFKSQEEQDLALVTDSFLKNALVYEINSLVGQFDPRYFM